MKLFLFILLLTPALSYGANVTQAQVKDVKTKTTVILQKALKIREYAVYVNSLFDKNFELDVEYSTTTIAIPTASKNVVIDITVYQAMKADLEAAVDALP